MSDKCPDPVPAAPPKVDPKPPAAESIAHAMSNREERIDRAAEAARIAAWAEQALGDYWTNHDGWELGIDQDIELILIDPTGERTRWSVRAEQSVTFTATEAGT